MANGISSNSSAAFVLDAALAEHTCKTGLKEVVYRICKRICVYINVVCKQLHCKL